MFEWKYFFYAITLRKWLTVQSTNAPPPPVITARVLESGERHTPTRRLQLLISCEEVVEQNGFLFRPPRPHGPRGVVGAPGRGAASAGDHETVPGPKGEMRQGLRNRLDDSGPAGTQDRPKRRPAR